MCLLSYSVKHDIVLLLDRRLIASCISFSSVVFSALSLCKVAAAADML